MLPGASRCLSMPPWRGGPLWHASEHLLCPGFQRVTPGCVILYSNSLSSSTLSSCKMQTGKHTCRWHIKSCHQPTAVARACFFLPPPPSLSRSLFHLTTPQLPKRCDYLLSARVSSVQPAEMTLCISRFGYLQRLHLLHPGCSVQLSLSLIHLTRDQKLSKGKCNPIGKGLTWTTLAIPLEGLKTIQSSTMIQLSPASCTEIKQGHNRLYTGPCRKFQKAITALHSLHCAIILLLQWKLMHLVGLLSKSYNNRLPDTLPDFAGQLKKQKQFSFQDCFFTNNWSIKYKPVYILRSCK